jgi:hypothetical protein
MKAFYDFLEDSEKDHSCLDESRITLLETINFLVLFHLDTSEESERSESISLIERIALINHDLNNIKKEYLAGKNLKA